MSFPGGNPLGTMLYLGLASGGLGAYLLLATNERDLGLVFSILGGVTLLLGYFLRPGGGSHSFKT